MNSNISSKRLLLIAPLFFDYYKSIIEESEKMGFRVDYICDAPSNSNVSKALARVNKKLILFQTNKYYKKRLVPIVSQNEYDVVLLIAGMTFAFSEEMIKNIRDRQRKALFVMYQWDSEKNLPYSKRIHRYFDRIFTFDRFDADNQKVYRFLPLFYTREYEEIAKKPRNKTVYDCMYVGTAHPKKYKEINRIASLLKNVLPRQYIYHYMPSLLKYVYQKAFDKQFRNAKLKDFGKKKLSKCEIIDLMKKSFCVLDSPQDGQTGLTIRTIECLGAQRKLITNNIDIKKYDFYNPVNILIFDSDTVDTGLAFFTEDYASIPTDIYHKYSIENWLKTMIA